MPIVVSGDLSISGPDVEARFRGSGDGPATLVVAGRPPGGRRALRRLAARATEWGPALVVHDGRGRRLAVVGPAVRSPLGALALGTARARPTAHGLLAALRGAAARRPTDRGGSA